MKWLMRFGIAGLEIAVILLLLLLSVAGAVYAILSLLDAL